MSDLYPNSGVDHTPKKEAKIQSSPTPRKPRYDAKYEINELKVKIEQLESQNNIMPASFFTTPNQPEIRLFDFMMTSELLWEKMKKRNGLIRNYLLRGKPVELGCQRDAALDQIVTSVNEVLRDMSKGEIILNGEEKQ